MEGLNESGFRGRLFWLQMLAIVIFGQAVLTLERFGGWAGVIDARPVLVGRHPLHLYHGMLGAETFHQRYATACYDPAFQAGYPKTPVFDSGCRPAELVLYLAGSGDKVVAYKIGLFILCALAPLAFAVAAVGIGLSDGGACLAAALGSCVWWTSPVQTLFDAGDIDLLLAGLCAIVFVAWLSRYHWDASPTSWLLLALTALVGWYAHPVIWLGLTPVVAVYYIAVAPRHGPAWHLGLVGITGVGLAPNMWWLWDWGRFWWLRQPSVDDVAPFPTWGALLGCTSENLSLLGHGWLGWPFVAFAAISCLCLVAMRKRTTPLVLLFTATLAAIVARLGENWPPFMNGGAARAAPLVAALAVLPIAGFLSIWAKHARIGPPALAVLSLLPIFLACGGSMAIPIRRACQLETSPLLLGLNDDQLRFVQGLTTHTNDDARILLEDIPPGARPGWNWTALPATLTSRSYLGGLDPDAQFEHAYCGLMANHLNGRPLSEWTDSDLAEIARRYNVGWVAARSPETIARWRAFPGTKELARFQDGGEVVLFSLDRVKSFILVGQAKWEQADRRKVVLTDVVPADAPHPDGGPIPAKVIVLSLHHQPGLRISPNIVAVDATRIRATRSRCSVCA